MKKPLLAMLLLGCASDPDAPTAAPADPNDTPDAAPSAGCRAGQFHVAGRCTAPSPDTSCPAGQERDGGTCMPLPTCEGSPFTCGVSEPKPSAPYAPPRFRVVTVGTLPGTEQASSALGVNDKGQIVGTARRTDAQGTTVYAFRFSEVGGFEDVGPSGKASVGIAIRDDGLVLGLGNDDEKAFLADGTSVQHIGAEYTGGTARGWAINAAGTVVGECDVAGLAHVCSHAAGGSWVVEPEAGAAFSVATDGSTTGVSGAVTSGMFWRGAGPMRDLGPRSPFHSVGYAISPQGRWVVGQHGLPQLVGDGVGVLVDVSGAEPPRFLGDADRHPWRDLFVQPFAVNDQGFVVGLSQSARGDEVGFLYDARRGETYDLNELVDLPPSTQVVDARGISNTGFVAATLRADGILVAAVLVPKGWSSALAPVTPLVLGDELFEASAVPQNDALPGQSAVALDETDRVAVLEPFAYSEGALVRRESSWRTGQGGAPLLVAGEVFPARTSPAGTLIANGWIRDEFTDARFYKPFVSVAGAPFTFISTPDDVLHAFGVGVDDAGNLLAECLTEAGSAACARGAEGTWSTLFLGRPHAFSRDGVAGGETAEDAVLVDAAGAHPLGLGAGAAVYALSRDGRYAAGVAGHAFVYDRTTAVFDWLPDLAGDPATSLHVLPRAVNRDGDVTGAAFDEHGRSFAFLYRARSGRFLRLQEHVADFELRLTEGRDLNDHGVVVANAIATDGATHAVLLRPLTPQQGAEHSEN